MINLNAAFAELDYDESPADVKLVIEVLEATKLAWEQRTQADYDKIVWGEERPPVQREELAEHDE